MKKLFTVLVLVLAINFLAAAGGVGYLFKSGKLNREKLMAIKDVVFPKPEPVAPATQPTTQPVLKLQELLAQYAGRPPVEQLKYIQDAFDGQMRQLERAREEMNDLKAQAEAAQAAARRERDALDQQRKQFAAQQQQAAKLAADKGFQDSLALYQSLPAKQSKSLMMGLDVETAVQYLQAMEPRTAARITKEFKSPAEAARLKEIMDRMRTASAQTASTP